MALPELPDDRRAQPRRYGPANPPPPPPGDGRVPVGDPRWAPADGGAVANPGGPAAHRAGPPPGGGRVPPGQGPDGRPPYRGPAPDHQDGQPRRPAGPPGPRTNGRPADDGRTNGRPVDDGRANGRPVDDGRANGAPPERPRRPAPPNGRPPVPPNDRVRPVLRDDPLATEETDVLGETVEDAPPEPRTDRRPPREDAAARNGRPVERPRTRRPPVREDDPRADADGDTAVPGRHRRRAGESPEGRPVSSFASETGPKGRKPKSGRRRRTSFWKELPLLILVALLLTFLIQTFLAKVYVIPSGSMETTLHGCTGCNNDRVLVDKITYRFSDPEPGDVVVFRGPDSWGTEQVSVPGSSLVRGLQQVGSLIGLAPPDEKDFVKRVIATGGQTVACCDSRNRLMVNGKPLDEPYIYYLPEAGPARQVPFGPVTVPAGELWMMGDSRNNSSDSRATGHGPVPVANVIGKARLKVLPFNRFGPISAIDPQSPDPVGMGVGGGAPLALGMIGTLPLAVGRRRRDRLADNAESFLPSQPRSLRLRRR